MALTIKKENLPGYKTAKAIYNALPGKGIVKAVVVGVSVAALVVAGIAAAVYGIPLLIGAVTTFLAAGLLTQIGILISVAIIFTLILGAIRYVYNFNWMIGDNEIEKQIEESFKKFYERVGEVVGRTVGFVLCGALPGSLVFAFNPVLAKVIFAELADDVVADIYQDLASIATNVFATLANAMLLKGFKSARRWIKRPGTPMHDAIKSALGKKRFDAWGKDGQPSLTFASQVEEGVENIKDERLRNFTEGFIEGITDGCVDSAYTVVTTVDSYMAAQRLMNKSAGLNNDEELIEISIGEPG